MFVLPTAAGRIRSSVCPSGSPASWTGQRLPVPIRFPNAVLEARAVGEPQEAVKPKVAEILSEHSERRIVSAKNERTRDVRRGGFTF